MLPETERERAHVNDYMRSQAPDLSVEFLQKVYSETLDHVKHDVWDVHTSNVKATSPAQARTIFAPQLPLRHRPWSAPSGKPEKR